MVGLDRELLGWVYAITYVMNVRRRVHRVCKDVAISNRFGTSRHLPHSVRDFKPRHLWKKDRLLSFIDRGRYNYRKISNAAIIADTYLS